MLWSFTGHADGAFPSGDLVFDNAGNFYGAARIGGRVSVICRQGCGTIFKGIPPATPDGPWSGALLWSFSGPDGGGPGPLIFDAAGTALYGTTSIHGVARFNPGAVFKLTP